MANWRNLLASLICAALLLAPAIAEARAGGSYSAGGAGRYSSQGSLGSRTYGNNGAQPVERSMTSPAQNGSAAFGRSPGFMQSHPFITGLAGAFFGSWLGSLLFPHWGFGMGFGGVFGSLFMWILIIVGISMVFRLFRRGASPLTMPRIDGGMRSGELPPGFGFGGGAATPASRDLAVSATDYTAFEAILKAVQGAWSKGDLRELGHYVTPEMLSYFSEELAANASQGVTNHVEQIELVNGDVRQSWDEGRLHYATCLLRWRGLDYTVRTDRKPGEPGWVVDGDPQRPSDAQEMWTFARTPGGHWLLSAIQQV
jgi:Tim44-like domain